jgi:membrane protein DedA with SNARE-associated domain
VPDLSHLIERVIAWVEPLYATYGYVVVVLAALLEHTFFLAWAMPGGLLVALGGLYAQTGVLSLPLVIASGALGFVLGDHIDYVVGKRGKRLLPRVTRGRSVRASSLFTLRAAPALLLAYTNTIPRAAVFMGGSASGLSYGRFLALSATLAVFWSAVFSVLGYALGSNRQRLAALLQTIGVTGQAILIAGVASILLYLYVKRRRQASRTEEMPQS